MERKTHLDQQYEDDQLIFRLKGRLDVHSVADLWTDCFAAREQYNPKSLVVDTTGLDYCDSAGAGLLLTLKSAQQKANRTFSLVGLQEKFQYLLQTLEDLPAIKPEQPVEQLSFVERLGQWGDETIELGRSNLTFLGEMCYELFRGVLKPSIIRWGEVWRVIEDTGPNALPIIALIGFLVGLITSFQSAVPLGRFGAKVYIANLVGIGLTREMGPLMVAILLAGRTASSFAAEIGTMKVNQEVDALKTMGVSSMMFLVVPRVIAVMLMAPILNLFLILFGLVGSAMFMSSIGYAWEIFYKQLHNAVTMGDFMGGMVKTVVFGVVIASIGCLYGLRTRFGASSVGESTTKAVVSCLVMIVIVDGLFAVVFYVLGF